MSLQLVLAGLYPPSPEQKWNKELNWQPVPAIFVTSKEDWLMIPEECPE
jgi:prostatic aicd phosphatase